MTANKVPKGLEWLASIAEREMDRRREELIRELVARDKQMRQASKPPRMVTVAKAVRKPTK